MERPSRSDGSTFRSTSLSHQARGSYRLVKRSENLPACSNIWISQLISDCKVVIGFCFSLLHVQRLQVTGRWRYAGPSVAMAKAIEARQQHNAVRLKSEIGDTGCEQKNDLRESLDAILSTLTT